MLFYLVGITPIQSLGQAKHIASAWPFFIIAAVGIIESSGISGGKMWILLLLLAGGAVPRIAQTLPTTSFTINAVVFTEQQPANRPRLPELVVVDSTAAGLLLPKLLRLDDDTQIFVAQQSELIQTPQMWLPQISTSLSTYVHIGGNGSTIEGKEQILAMIQEEDVSTYNVDANGQRIESSNSDFVQIVPHDIPSDFGVQRVNWRVGEELMLIGYRIEHAGQTIDSLAPGQSFTMILYWQTIHNPVADYTAFAHLEDAAGNIIATFDVPPTNGQYPTSMWRVDEVYTSTHPLTISPDSDIAEPFQLFVGMYTWPSLERLPISGAASVPDDQRIPLTEIPLNN